MLAGEGAKVAFEQSITSKIESKGNILHRFLPKELSAKLDAARAGEHVVGERRMVTMLFCDIAGSTAAAENLDPEEWTEIINGAFEHMIRPVYKYEGTVARLMGDAILAFFGAPIAHEDDPVRAVLAGLDIVAGFTTYKEHVRDHHGLHINLRVGINTGMVVTGAVGSDLRMEYTAMGDAVNLAARMEQSAEPGSVQITESTCELVKPWFEVQEIGSILVKGKGEPVNAYRVIGRRPQFDQKPDARHAEVRLIGRERELARLIWAARHLVQGVGRALCIAGEAGLGKSRLIDELEQQWPGQTETEESSLGGSEIEWHRSASFSYETLQPYALFQRLLRHMAGIIHGESEESAQKKIDQMIATFPENGQNRLSAVVKSLLGYSSELEGEAFKSELFAWLPEFFRHRFSTNPAVLVLDDIHWSDSASIELLLRLIPLVNEAAILLICLLRPDSDSSGWLVKQAMEEAGHSKREVILLRPLSEGDSTTLIDEMLAIPDLPEAIRRQILDKSAGNPFFVEEVVRALVARGFIISFNEERYWNVEVSEPLLIPENIQVLLTARIDRLAEETRHTLQLASVFGHSFYYQALLQVAQTEAELPDLSSQAIESHLTALENQQMILEAARIPARLYEFRHALTQEAVYKTILRSNRRVYHRLAGLVLEQFFANDLEEQATVLAQHFQAAGENQAAFRYFMLAGNRSFRLYALREAQFHYDNAMAILRQSYKLAPALLIDLCEQRGRVLELLGEHVLALNHYQEMAAIASSIKDDQLALVSMMAQAVLYNTPSAVMDAEMGEQTAQSARQLADKLGDWEASAKLAWTLMLGATWVEADAFKAIRYGEESLRIAREHNLERQMAYSGLDLVPVYMSVGRIDDARLEVDAAQARMAELSDKPLLAQAYRLSGNLYYMLGQLDESESEVQRGALIERAIDNRWGLLAAEHCFSMVDYERGDAGRAIERMEWTINETLALRLAPMSVYVMSYLALSLAMLGDWQSSLDTLNLAYEDPELAASFPHWLRPYHASIHTLVLLQKGDVAEATRTNLASQTGFNPADPLIGGVLFAPVTIRLANIGVLLAHEEPEKALETTDELLDYVTRMRMKLYLPEVFHLKGKALQSVGRLGEARQHYELALSESEGIGERRMRWQILGSLAEVARNEPAEMNFRESARDIVAYIADHAGTQERRMSFLKRTEIQALGTEASISS